MGLWLLRSLFKIKGLKLKNLVVLRGLKGGAWKYLF